MKRITIILCIGIIYLANSFAQPTNNPVRNFYGNGDYPIWTDQIKWHNVIDMSNYSNGGNDFEKFENARDELYNEGGGVLYYPAGTYDFSDMPAHGKDGRGLMLKSGVVIRGQQPSNDQDASDGSISLPVTFKFPSQSKGGGTVPEDWSFVGLTTGTEQVRNINNIGIVWINIKYGAVYFGYETTFGATMGSAGAWKSDKVKSDWADRVPDGTHPMDGLCSYDGNDPKFIGSGSGRLVFGCKLEHSTILNDIIDESQGAAPGFFYMYKFGARIQIYASDILVANNYIPESNQNFFYNQVTNSGSEKKLMFDYGKTFGLDINKSNLNPLSNKYEGYLQDNVIIRDNYIFNHGTKGFELCGNWMVIRDNTNDREYLQEGADVYGIGGDWELTLDGWYESEAGGSGSVSDNLSRAFDMAGRNGWLENNWYSETGSDPGNDGEGILWQVHGGMSDIESFALTNNTHVQQGGERGYMGGYDIDHRGTLIAWNTTPGWVGNRENKSGAQVDAAVVDNDAAEGVQTTGSDVITNCPGTSPEAPTNVNTTVSADTTYVEITWDDNSSSEIGFRVDKKQGSSGSWKTIAYRPRNSTGASVNEQKWRDYMPPRGVEVNYRVVAINCNDEGGSTSAPNSVYIKPPSQPTKITPAHHATIHVYPNPSKEIIYIQQARNGRFALYDINGKKRMRQKSINSNHEKIDISGIPKGIYLIRIKTGNQVKTRKIIKE